MTGKWENKILGEVLSLEYGKPLPQPKRKHNGAWPVYGANGIKAMSDEYYYEQRTIIVGRKGSAGELTLTAEKFWPLDVTYFTVFDATKYSLMFLYYLLSSLNLPALAKGVKPGINRNDVYSIAVRIPPLPEQKRIVSILNEAFAGIDKAKEKAQKNLANARELSESYLHKVFTESEKDWKHKKLGDIFIFINGRGFKKAEWKEAGVPIIRIQNLNNSKAPFNFYQGDYDMSIEINSGDLLFSWSGTVGTSFGSHLWEGEKGVLNQHIFKVVSKIEIEPRYAYHALGYITQEVEKQVSGAVGLVHITKKKLNQFTILFPDIQMQKSMAAKLDAWFKKTLHLELIYQQKLADLEELKKAILQKAFNGELKG